MNEKAKQLRQHFVKHRSFKFDVNQDLSCGITNDPFRSQWINAISTGFPIGEKLFIDSVRFYRDKITDSTLQHNIKEFIQQEANHSKEHNVYNENLKRYFSNIDDMNESIKCQYAWLYKHTSPMTRLSITIAIEHLTAMMAEGVFKYGWLKNAKPEFACIWEWHAIEELDHKSVAFDVYQQVGGGYWRRMFGWVVANAAISIRTFCRTMSFLRQQHVLLKCNTWVKMIRFCFGINGLIHHLFIRGSFEYMNPKFHPWNNDNYHFIAEWESRNNNDK